MENCVAGAALKGPQEKHAELANAIGEIDSVTVRLNELILRINGDHSAPDNAKNPSAEPTLISVLEGGPGVIRDKCASAHNAIDGINNLLF